MDSDIRASALYREAEALQRSLKGPGAGQICDAAEVNASPDGSHAVFAGALYDKLEGSPPTRICRVDLTSGDTRVLSFGPNTDRLPKYSPDGQHIAFLSDRLRPGDFQLYLLDPASGAARATPPVDGWIEYLHWSPDGTRILLGVAGHGADISGGQGAVTSKEAVAERPSWIPTVDRGEESYRWRRAWVYELTSHQVRQISPAHLNVWEAVWCGNTSIAAITSPTPGEGSWYSARLHILGIDNPDVREMCVPREQLGWPAASPSGKKLAFVEAVCSDRWIVAGELRLIDMSAGGVLTIDTHGIDVTYTEWRSDQHLLLGGHRGFDTVVGLYDAASEAFTELWCSSSLTTGGRYICVSGFNDVGDCVLIGESFDRAPEVAVIRAGEYRAAKSFDVGYAEHAGVIGAIERVSWKAPDGLEILGWLLCPQGKAPYPVIMNIHGGPVWHWRPVWLGRANAFVLMLLKRGYAVFFPNPRGSGGRGQAFARRVKGDMNGADTKDYLAGLDGLIERGIADPSRLGVTGVSYGGNMSAWLITQDARFAAAVPVAPHTNQVTEHLLSNIPHFMALFLDDHYTNPAGKYFERSPIMHARKVRTPTLNICGALDRCTPPEEAVQFHNALLENGVKSVLVTYPQEGHGIRTLPAAIDYAARVVGWFEEHIPIDNRTR